MTSIFSGLALTSSLFRNWNCLFINLGYSTFLRCLLRTPFGQKRFEQLMKNMSLDDTLHWCFGNGNRHRECWRFYRIYLILLFIVYLLFVNSLSLKSNVNIAIKLWRRLSRIFVKIIRCRYPLFFRFQIQSKGSRKAEIDNLRVW